VQLAFICPLVPEQAALGFSAYSIRNTHPALIGLSDDTALSGSVKATNYLRGSK
jgi:hypothetical protein